MGPWGGAQQPGFYKPSVLAGDPSLVVHTVIIPGKEHPLCAFYGMKCLKSVFKVSSQI